MAYCKKCGKEIEDDAMLCKECEENEMFFGADESVTAEAVEENIAMAEVIEEVKPAPVGNRKEGLGLGLAATIVGVIVAIIGGAAYAWCYGTLSPFLEAEEISTLRDAYWVYALVPAIVSVFGIMLAIPALIFGISAISCFKKAAKAGRVKPVATLILGIVGVVQSASGILYSVLVIFLAILIKILIGF